MGIEIYEEKVKTRKLEEQNKTKSLKESREAKEREQEILETARLCAEYHDKLDPTGYFNSKAAKVASELLPEFVKINKKLLPESLRNVLNHRIAYLAMMSEVNKNSNICKFLDKMAPSLFGGMGIFNSDFKSVLAECNKYPEFKKLTSADFKKAYSIVASGFKHLQAVTRVRGNWQDDAKKHLQNRKTKFFDKRVDDLDAARNLQDGLKIAAKNLRLLEIQKSLKSA